MASLTDKIFGLPVSDLQVGLAKHPKLIQVVNVQVTEGKRSMFSGSSSDLSAPQERKEGKTGHTSNLATTKSGKISGNGSLVFALQ